jgi:hypothetical protein
MNELEKEIKAILRNNRSYFIDYKNGELSFGKLADIISKEVSSHKRRYVSRVDVVDLAIFNNEACEMSCCHGKCIFFKLKDGSYSGMQDIGKKPNFKLFRPVESEITIELMRY